MTKFLQGFKLLVSVTIYKFARFLAPVQATGGVRFWDGVLGIRHLQQEHGRPWAGEAALHQIDAPGSAE
jgi:hypothetical protein